MIMPAHEIEVLLVTRPRAWVAGLFPALQLSEDPGIEQSAAANSNAGTVGFREHSGRIGKVANVPVADNRDAFHGFGDGPYPIEADRAGKTLGARSPMNNQTGDTHFLKLASEMLSAPARFIPADAH